MCMFKERCFFLFKMNHIPVQNKLRIGLWYIRVASFFYTLLSIKLYLSALKLYLTRGLEPSRNDRLSMLYPPFSILSLLVPR